MSGKDQQRGQPESTPAPSFPGTIEMISPAATQQALHELRAHQIDLEAQNEKLRRAQAELAAERARYFDLYDKSPAGYVTLSEQGLIMDANRAAAVLLGVSQSALANQPFFRFILKEDQDVFRQHRKQIFETGKPLEFELRMLKHDGAKFYAWVAATAAKDSDDTPACRVVMSDITTPKRVEEYREMGREVLKIFNEPGDLPDLFQRVLSVLEIRTGFDAVGIRLQEGDDFPYFAQRGFSKYFLQTENTLIERSQNGVVCRDKNGNVSLECTCGLVISGRTGPANPLFTQGGSFWTNNSFPLLDLAPDHDPRLHPRNKCIHQGYASMALVPISNEDKNVGLLHFNDRRKDCFTLETIQILEEIASHIGLAMMRKLYETALRISKTQLLAILESTADAILAVDDHGKVLQASRRFRELWQAPQSLVENGDDQSLLKFAMNQLLDPDAFLKKVRELYDSDADAMDVLAFKDGRIIERYSIAIKMDGRRTGRVWSFRDITERKKFEDERNRLEAQNRQLQKSESLGRMAGAIAHRFNNNLMAVIGNLELAIEGTPHDARLFKTLNASLNAAGQAAEVSRAMLTYLGHGFGRHTRVDLSTICRQSLPLMCVNVPESTGLTTELPDPGPIISADAIQMQQVLTNLLTNAWEAIGNGGGVIRLTVKTVSPSDIQALPHSCLLPVDWQPNAKVYACLEVADTGVGIAGKDMENLFDPFFSTKLIGRGLGLAVALGIVRAHDGGIMVRSESGRGCTIRAFIPVLSEAVPLSPSQATPAPKTAMSGSVLLIDDDEAVRKVAAVMIEKCGFKVLTAVDGVEGLEIFRQHNADICCVLSDLTMPRMDGWETLTALRGMRPGLPVILASGYDEAQVMAGDHPEKPQAFLGKPYQMQALRGAFEIALAV